MKYFLLGLLSMGLLFIMFMILSIAILRGFPQDHWLRKFWEKHIMTSEDLDPPTE